MLASRGRIEETITQYQEALKIKHNHVKPTATSAPRWQSKDKLPEAITHYHRALKINPDFSPALNNLAWLRATYPKAAFRDAGEAVELALHVFRLSDGRDPTVLDTLAAAYAEARRFPEAVQTAQKAVDLAKRQSNEALAERVKARLRLYEARTPYRERRPRRRLEVKREHRRFR